MIDIPVVLESQDSHKLSEHEVERTKRYTPHVSSHTTGGHMEIVGTQGVALYASSLSGQTGHIVAPEGDVRIQDVEHVTLAECTRQQTKKHWLKGKRTHEEETVEEVVASQGARLYFKESLAIEGRTGIHMTNPSLHSAEIALRSEGDIHVAVGRNTHKVDHQHTYKNALGTRTKADGFHHMTPAPLDIVGEVRVSCGRLSVEVPEGQYGPVLGVETRAQKRARLMEAEAQNAEGLSGGQSAVEGEDSGILREFEEHRAQELAQPGTELALIMEKGALHTTQVKPYGTSYERKVWAPSQGLKVASSIAMAALTAVVAPVAVGAMGITNTVGAVVAQGALTATASTFASKTLDHGGHVGKALKDMTREDGLQALGKTIVLKAGTLVGLSEVGQATAGAPWMVREGAKYGMKVGARAVSDPSQAFERHIVGALVERVGEEAAKEIGILYRPQALKNAGLAGKGPERSGQLALKGSTEIFTVGSSTGIGYVEHKFLHALSGGIQGAVLDLKNPGQGALWGAIGAAGGEVAMEAVYDPKARSEAIIADILKLKRQELSQLSKEQFSKSVQELLVKEMRADLERTRDLVRAGMSVTALAGGVDGAQMSTMDDMASRATEENFFLQAIGIGLAVWETARIVGESLDVCQKEGLGAALAHAGVETAKEVALAVTGVKVIKLAGKALKLAKGSKIVGKVGEKIASALPEAVGGFVPDAVKTTVQQATTLVKKGANALGTLDRKLDTAVSTQVQKLRGRGATAGAGQSISAPQVNPAVAVENKGTKALPVGTSQAKTRPIREVGPLVKEKPRWQTAGELPLEQQHFSQGTKELLGGHNKYKENLFEREGKPKTATSLRAANIESRGGQIDVAIERQVEMDHVTKVQKAQKGLGDHIQAVKYRLGYPHLPTNEQTALQGELSKSSKLLDHTVKFVPKPKKVKKPEVPHEN